MARLGPWLLGTTLLAQVLLFHGYYAQPLMYDAAQYVHLRNAIDWSSGLPILGPVGPRTYLYPALLASFAIDGDHLWADASGPLIIQSILLVASFFLLRYRLLPHGLGWDIAVTLVLWALPVLPAYALVLLTDLPGALALQIGLLLLSDSIAKHPASASGDSRLTGNSGKLQDSASGGREPTDSGLSGGRWKQLFLAGFVLAVAMQIRPTYLLLAGPLFLVALLVSFRAGRSWQAVLIGILAYSLGWTIPGIPTVLANWRHQQALSFGPPSDGALRYHLVLGLHMQHWSANPVPRQQFQRAMELLKSQGVYVKDYLAPPWSKVRELLFKHRYRLHRQVGRHLVAAYRKTELFPYAGRTSAMWRMVLDCSNILVITFYILESLCRSTDRRQPAETRLFAALQLLLLTYLTVTVAMVVPEERHTLAIYPVALLFAVAFADRVRCRFQKCGIGPKFSG